MSKRKRSRSATASEGQRGDHAAGERSLYQPLFECPRALRHSDSLAFLAEKAGESLSAWKARVDNKVLHLNEPPPEQTSLVLAAAEPDYTVRLPCSKFSRISNRAAKRAGFFDVKSVPYETALAFNALWADYARKLLGAPQTHLAACRLVAMLDLQGALLEVVRSSCASYVGIAGVVLRETQNVRLPHAQAFCIACPSSRVLFVLKNASVFRLDYGEWSFFIHGRHIAASPAQRSKSKLKAKASL